MVLNERKLLMPGGALMDATNTTAPSATRNKSGEQDPQMHRAKDGNQWYFGMMAHLGGNTALGLVGSIA